MTNEVYPNKVVVLRATPDDQVIKEIQLDRVTVSLNEQVVKTLKTSKEGNTWTSYLSFQPSDMPGDYKIDWQFSINGQILHRYDTVKLQDALKTDVELDSFVLSPNETWEECEQKSREYIKRKKPGIKGDELDKEVEKLCGFIRQRGMTSASSIADPETIPPEILLMINRSK